MYGSVVPSLLPGVTIWTIVKCERRMIPLMQCPSVLLLHRLILGLQTALGPTPAVLLVKLCIPGPMLTCLPGWLGSGGRRHGLLWFDYLDDW